MPKPPKQQSFTPNLALFDLMEITKNVTEGRNQANSLSASNACWSLAKGKARGILQRNGSL
jgi:hypothetical protein